MTGKPQGPAVKRDCPHQKRHDHGTTAAYKADECRCPECRAACAAEWRRRNRLKVYGRYPVLQVDPTGSARRLQALAAMGWSARILERRSGMGHAHIQRIRNCTVQFITPRTQQRISRLYDELWDKHPVPANRFERTAVTYAKKFAAAHGWVLPLAWDDESIDDPAAVPQTRSVGPSAEPDQVAIAEALRGQRRVRLTRDETRIAIEQGTAQGLTAVQLAERLGVTTRCVARNRSAVAA